uniref:Uncharacterized protein n=1 Tax=Aureoumbra lagunensis TaxID=44058 RepID=A0A6S8E839_9STRA|mmetsp:Transcript_16118/g.21095  ORF Transcript_16118/g.21095 Transcript_16118/m.21095 type:complete len:592 (-) Transcript_16118:21-1796(-)
MTGKSSNRQKQNQQQQQQTPPPPPANFKDKVIADVEKALQDAGYTSQKTTKDVLSMIGLNGIHNHNSGWVTKIDKVTGPNAEIYGGNGSKDFDQRQYLANLQKTETAFSNLCKTTTLRKDASLSRQLTELFNSLSTPACKAVVATRGYAELIFVGGKIYYDKLEEFLYDTVYTGPNGTHSTNYRTRGSPSGTMAPIDGDFHQIGTEVLQQWNEFEEAMKETLKLQPEYDPDTDRFDPARAINPSEYACAAGFVKSNLLVWLQRSRHNLDPIPSEPNLIDSKALVSIFNQVHAIISVVKPEVTHNELAEYHEASARFDALLNLKDLDIALSEWISLLDKQSFRLTQCEEDGDIPKYLRTNHANLSNRMVIVRSQLVPWLAQQQYPNKTRLKDSYIWTASTYVRCLHDATDPMPDAIASAVLDWENFKSYILNKEKAHPQDVHAAKRIDPQLHPLPPFELLQVKQSTTKSTALFTDDDAFTIDDGLHAYLTSQDDTPPEDPDAIDDEIFIAVEDGEPIQYTPVYYANDPQNMVPQFYDPDGKPYRRRLYDPRAKRNLPRRRFSPYGISRSSGTTYNNRNGYRTSTSNGSRNGY